MLKRCYCICFEGSAATQVKTDANPVGLGAVQKTSRNIAEEYVRHIATPAAREAVHVKDMERDLQKIEN
jgi:hypothetical protein